MKSEIDAALNKTYWLGVFHGVLAAIIVAIGWIIWGLR